MGGGLNLIRNTKDDLKERYNVNNHEGKIF